jgi:hypothetical protein
MGFPLRGRRGLAGHEIGQAALDVSFPVAVDEERFNVFVAGKVPHFF